MEAIATGTTLELQSCYIPPSIPNDSNRVSDCLSRVVLCHFVGVLVRYSSLGRRVSSLPIFILVAITTVSRVHHT